MDAAVITAQPFALTAVCKVHAGFISWVAVAVGIGHFYVKHSNVGTVCNKALRTQDRRQLEFGGRASGDNFLHGNLRTAVVTNRTDLADLPGHIRKTKLELVRLRAQAIVLNQRTTAVVGLQAHLLHIRHNVNVLDGASGVVPVAHNVDGGRIALGGLHGVIRFLGQAHRIGHTADTRQLGIRHASVADRIGKDDLGPTHHDVCQPLTTTLGPTVIVFLDVDTRQVFRAVVQEARHRVFHQRIGRVGDVVVAKAGGRVLVPDTARGFFAGVFRVPERVRVGCGGVIHRRQILRDRFQRIRRGTRAAQATTVRVVLIVGGLHLGHVFEGDVLVACFPEDNAGVVFEINGDVAHQLYALIPLTTSIIAFGVTGGHGVDHAVLIGGLDVRHFGTDMHRADEVRT